MGAARRSGQWVNVGDSGADIFTFWEVCRNLGCAFVIRLCQNRLVALPQEEQEGEQLAHYLRDEMQRLPAQDARVLHVRAEHQRPARDALLQISFQQMAIQPPQHGASWAHQELTAWIILVW